MLLPFSVINLWRRHQYVIQVDELELRARKVLHVCTSKSSYTATELVEYLHGTE